jgi:hypothetical protein
LGVCTTDWRNVSSSLVQDINGINDKMRSNLLIVINFQMLF